jgi:cytidine deaminase
MKEITLHTHVKIYKPDELDADTRYLIEKAKQACMNAYAPYSEFCVGAAVRLANGNIYWGNNQENAAYPSGLCAERVALYYANAQHPLVAVKELAIVAKNKDLFTPYPISPCGGCRQTLLEAEQRYQTDIRIILYGTELVYTLSNCKEMLPIHFGQEAFK